MSVCSAVTFAVVWPVTPPAVVPASITTTSRPARWSSSAAVRPVTPAPTTHTCAVVFSASGGCSGADVVSIQSETALPGREVMRGRYPGWGGATRHGPAPDDVDAGPWTARPAPAP